MTYKLRHSTVLCHPLYRFTMFFCYFEYRSHVTFIYTDLFWRVCRSRVATASYRRALFIYGFLFCITFVRVSLLTLTLQHTAIHCNARQHTETHGNTRQHTATHGNTRQHTATYGNIRPHTATHGHTRQHTATHGNPRQPTATHGETLQHTATHCNTQSWRRILPRGNAHMVRTWHVCAQRPRTWRQTWPLRSQQKGFCECKWKTWCTNSTRAVYVWNRKKLCASLRRCDRIYVLQCVAVCRGVLQCVAVYRICVL